MVEGKTTPRDRVFAMTTLATAYSTREVQQNWHNSRAAQLTDALRSALVNPVMVRIQADWPATALRGVRLVATSDWREDWRIFEVRLSSPNGVLHSTPWWFLKASPNIWEAFRAFDGNRATYWSSREPEGKGMYLEVDLDNPETVSSIEVISERTKPVETMLIQGLTPEGKWKLLADGLHTEVAPPLDTRRDAIRSLKSAGFTCVLVSAEGQGTARIGRDMQLHSLAWGVEDIANIGPVHLFRLL
jgi:hypothetical protein